MQKKCDLTSEDKAARSLLFAYTVAMKNGAAASKRCSEKNAAAHECNSNVRKPLTRDTAVTSWNLRHCG